MRTKITILGVFLAIFGSDVVAADPVYFCEDCRRTGNYAEDFGNFAFNAVLGRTPWIGLGGDLATYTQPLLVENRYGQIAGVYFVNLYGLGSTLKIRVEKPNGVLEEYRVLRSRVGTNLGVGRPGSNRSGPNNGGSGGGGSSGGGHGGGGGGGSGGSGSNGGSNNGGDTICGYSQVDDGHRRRTCLRD